MTRRLLAAATAAITVATLGVLAPTPAAAAPHRYEVELLGPPASATLTDPKAVAINARGDVIGTHRVGDTIRTVFWSSDDRSRTVTVTEGPAGATGVNSSGTVVGTDTSSSYTWTGGVRTQLALGNGFTANGISDSGSIIAQHGGTAHLLVSSNLSQLGNRVGGTGINEVYATTISRNGRWVAGFGNHGSDTEIPIRWENRTLQRLELPVGATAASVLDVAEDGTAVGSAKGSGYLRPVIWGTAGEASWLHASRFSAIQEARAINSAGIVVGDGRGVNQSRPQVAFLWGDEGIYNLNDLSERPTGVTLRSALDINDAGQIVGQATLANGTLVAYIATPKVVDVYTTPGRHSVNGREWSTTCEPYSQTQRCRTDIMATQVKYEDGTYQRVTDWAFNNLTYLPSDRGLWTNNPLGHKGEWTANDGRKWRTECDTAATGRNGCRSYARAVVLDAVANPRGGYTFTRQTTWVFNNVVRFK